MWTNPSGYSAWGVPLSAAFAAACSDPVGYGGKFGYYTDLETGLILCSHRYYDPRSCRWVNRDPLGYDGGIDLYAYCENNPVMGADPSGLAYEPLDLAVGAAFVCYDIYNVSHNYLNGASSLHKGIDNTALALDVAGLLPFVPPGAGRAFAAMHGVVAATHTATAAVRALHTTQVIYKGAQVASHVNMAKGSGPTSGNNAAAQRGKAEHAQLGRKADAKDGWAKEVTITDPKTGKIYRVDIMTKSGFFIELKPLTARGIQRGAAQVRKYSAILGKKGRVIYYNP